LRKQKKIQSIEEHPASAEPVSYIGRLMPHLKVRHSHGHCGAPVKVQRPSFWWRLWYDFVVRFRLQAGELSGFGGIMRSVGG
jgi:hypothetical protein